MVQGPPPALLLCVGAAANPYPGSIYKREIARVNRTMDGGDGSSNDVEYAPRWEHDRMIRGSAVIVVDTCRFVHRVRFNGELLRWSKTNVCNRGWATSRNSVWYKIHGPQASVLPTGQVRLGGGVPSKVTLLLPEHQGACFSVVGDFAHPDEAFQFQAADARPFYLRVSPLEWWAVGNFNITITSTDPRCTSTATPTAFPLFRIPTTSAVPRPVTIVEAPPVLSTNHPSPTPPTNQNATPQWVPIPPVPRLPTIPTNAPASATSDPTTTATIMTSSNSNSDSNNNHVVGDESRIIVVVTVVVGLALVLASTLAVAGVLAWTKKRRSRRPKQRNKHQHLHEDDDEPQPLVQGSTVPPDPSGPHRLHSFVDMTIIISDDDDDNDDDDDDDVGDHDTEEAVVDEHDEAAVAEPSLVTPAEFHNASNQSATGRSLHRRRGPEILPTVEEGSMEESFQPPPIPI